MKAGQNIVIFSPQRWNHLYISKHHYALELARNNHVWFISAPEEKMGSAYSISALEEMPTLKFIHYKILLPEIFKFKLPGIYKRATEKKLKVLVEKMVGKVDLCIDFGCYLFFNDLSFIKADKKIYFPVDDYGDLKLTDRGADKILSVSTNIVNKFNSAGLNCFFINHGLAATFAEKATSLLAVISSGNYKNRPLKFGYSGNLFIRFLDIPVLQTVITNHHDIEFHFFGNASFDPSDHKHAAWFRFLNSAPNVKLHGFLSPEKLSDAYEKMDGFLLCYKPDYKDYHAENSHKVFEYLSTGKVIVSTHLSLYTDTDLISMSPKDANHLFPVVFKKVAQQIENYNSEEMQQKRIAAALDNTYAKQIERIEKLFGFSSTTSAPAMVVT